MNYINIISASCVDFESWSTVLQVSGCDHMCKGCFNKQAWKSSYGKPFTEKTYRELIVMASKPYISNVCIQGGDIFFRKNREEGLKLIKRLHEDLPNKSIVVWTGYTLKEVQDDPLMSKTLRYIDYLIDGKYQQDSPTSKKWRGSDNQYLYSIKNGVPTLID